jgi:hypothetical protein
MNSSPLRWVRRLAVLTVVAFQATIGGAQPAAAAPGDLIADVSTPEAQTNSTFGIAKAVAFDGSYLYYAEYAGAVIHRINMPPTGASSASGHIDIPIVGAPSGIMTISYDRGRNLFWAVSGDGATIYQVSKTGMATRQFTVNTASLPGRCNWVCSAEVKISYDRTDDTIWYNPDASHRVYHLQTTPDITGNAVLVATTPYVDVDVPPNDMTPQCGYSQASGVVTGGTDLFFEVAGCNYYFEYTKTGTKVAAIRRGFATSGGLSCDNLTYAVSVIWMRDGWNGHIYAIEQPRANACAYGGG